MTGCCRVGEASGVSRTELFSIPSVPWSGPAASRTHSALAAFVAFVIGGADDTGAAGGVCIVGLTGLIVITDCCLTFQRLSVSPVLLL